MRKLVAVTAVAVLAVTAGCAGESDEGGAAQGAGSGTIKIGLPAAFTGPVTVPGSSMRAAAEIAVEEINADGGVDVEGKNYKLELVTADTKCDPAEAANAMQQLLTLDKVDYLVGGLCSTDVVASMALAQTAKVPYLITAASTSEIFQTIADKQYNYLFQFSPNDALVATATAQAMDELLHPRTLAILAEDTAAGRYQTQFVKDYFKQHAPDVDILSTDFVPQTAGTLLPQLTKLKRTKPDVVQAFFAGVNNNTLAEEIPQVGLDLSQTMLMAAGTEFARADFISKYPKVTENALVAVRWTPDMATDKTDVFRDKFRAKADRDVDMFALQEYDGIYTLVAALRDAAGTDADSVAEALESVEYEGVWGSHAFGPLSEGHQTTWDLATAQVQDGKLTAVWPEDEATKDVALPAGYESGGAAR